MLQSLFKNYIKNVNHEFLRLLTISSKEKLFKLREVNDFFSFDLPPSLRRKGLFLYLAGVKIV